MCKWLHGLAAEADGGRQSLFRQPLFRHPLGRYSDSRAVGLGLISVFGDYGQKQLSASSPKPVTLLLCQQSPIYGNVQSFSVNVQDRRFGYADRQT